MHLWFANIEVLLTIIDLTLILHGSITKITSKINIMMMQDR